MSFSRFPLWLSAPVLIFLVGALALAIFYRAELSTSYHRIEEFELSQVRLVGTIASADIEAAFRRNDPWEAQRALEHARSDRNLLRAALFDDAGMPLFLTHYVDRDIPLPDSPFAPLRSLAEHAIAQRDAVSKISADRTRLYAAFPVILATEPGELRPTRIGALLTINSLESPRFIATADARTRLQAAAFLLILSCVLLWMLFRRLLLQPIAGLISATERIADGHFQTPLPSRGNDELAQLSSALARMARRLEAGTIELRQKELYFRSVVENMSDVVSILDPELRFEYTSPSAARVVGAPPEELTGRYAIEGVHEEDAAELTRRLKDVVEGRAVIQEAICRYRLPDRDWGYFHSVAKPFDDGSVPHRIIVNSRNITENQLAEQALRESEERFISLFESVSDGVWAVSADGATFLYGNPAFERIAGRPVDEFKSNPNLWREFAHPDDLEIVRQSLRHLDDNGWADARYRIVRPDGEVRWIHDRKQLIYDDLGNILRKGGLVTDITEAKTAEEERDRMEQHLRHTQKMEAIGTLAGGVAHDFNNLLTAINGYAELLHDSMGEDHELIEEVREIRAAGERAASLTRQLLLFSRQEAARSDLINLNFIVENLGKMLRRLIGEHIEYSMSLSPEPLPVWADAGQIEQVIVNLAVNARDAMESGGTLDIRTERVTLQTGDTIRREPVDAGGYARLSVIDTGHGMSDSVLDRLFEPFFTTRDVGRGTGLGLATLYGIVRQCGGYIDVESAEGRGSTFAVYLPLASESASPSGQYPADPPSAATGETILFVEDERIVRDIGARILREQGYRVLVAPNGADALALVDRPDHNIDIVVTDVVMPSMTGAELAARLRERFPDIRILLTSGYADRTARRDGARIENFPFLQKPYNPQSLVAKVRQVLDLEV